MESQKKISNELKFEGNPRKINDKQKELLKKHIEELGDLSGVVYCQNQKAYVGGNQRSDIFDGAKIEIVKEFKKPNKSNTVANGFIIHNNERFAYREVKFNEEQFKQACIVANNDGGQNDWEILKDDYWGNDQLEEWGLDLPFEPEEVNLDDFFENDNSEPKEQKNKIVLEYTEEDYEKVIQKFNELDGSKENIILNKGSVQQLTNIPQHLKDKYKTVWEMPMKQLINMAVDRAPFICQSQSLNLWVEDPDYKNLTLLHFYAWEKGLKTGIYYLRRKAKHQAQQFTIKPSANNTTTTQRQETEECLMCSS